MQRDRYLKVKKALEKAGAQEMLEEFKKQGVDDDALPLLDTDSMKELGIPIGLRLKLRAEIDRKEDDEEGEDGGSVPSTSASAPKKKRGKRNCLVTKLIRWAPGLAVFVLMSPIGIYLLHELWSDYHLGIMNEIFAVVAVLYFIVSAACVAAVQYLWISHLARNSELPITAPDDETKEQRQSLRSKDDEAPEDDKAS